jgi:hypothetical protein
MLVIAPGPALLAQSQSANPGSGKCSDLPVSFTFLSTTVAPAAIWNDVASPYQNGVDGVDNTVIHRCYVTNDATMLLTKSKRFIWTKVPAPLAGSIIVAGPPSFAGGAAFQTQPFFNVRNVLNSGAITPTSPATDFYSRMVVNNFSGPDGNSHALYFHPEDAVCPGDLPCAPDLDAPSYPDMDLPVEASWVRVHFIPPPNPTQPWSLSNTAKWLVDGEMPDTVAGSYQRGTLYVKPSHGNGLTHQGQYPMPFQILITALGPL